MCFSCPGTTWRGKVSGTWGSQCISQISDSVNYLMELPIGANVPQIVLKETLTLDFQLVCTKGYMDGDS